ncbi:hypothetical protein ACJX0J_020516 [Zea mays]
MQKHANVNLSSKFQTLDTNVNEIYLQNTTTFTVPKYLIAHLYFEGFQDEKYGIGFKNTSADDPATNHDYMTKMNHPLQILYIHESPEPQTHEQPLLLPLVFVILFCFHYEAHSNQITLQLAIYTISVALALLFFLSKEYNLLSRKKGYKGLHVIGRRTIDLQTKFTLFFHYFYFLIIRAHWGPITTNLCKSHDSQPLRKYIDMWSDQLE